MIVESEKKRWPELGVGDYVEKKIYREALHASFYTQCVSSSSRTTPVSWQPRQQPANEVRTPLHSFALPLETNVTAVQDTCAIA